MSSDWNLVFSLIVITQWICPNCDLHITAIMCVLNNNHVTIDLSLLLWSLLSCNWLCSLYSPSLCHIIITKAVVEWHNRIWKWNKVDAVSTEWHTRAPCYGFICVWSHYRWGGPIDKVVDNKYMVLLFANVFIIILVACSHMTTTIMIKFIM